MLDFTELKHKLANNSVLKHFIPKKSLVGVHEYWKTRMATGDANAYTEYLKNVELSEYFVKIVDRYASNKNISIIELGCNVGRNLNAFFVAGYKNLYGIEINSHAIEAMKTYYPDMANVVKIYNSSIEDKIKELSEFDLVFTIAVLMHIHPDSEWIFEQIARITKNWLITFEDESGEATKNFPRNYKKIFEEFGLKEVEYIDKISGQPSTYKTRIFKKNE